MLASCGSNDSAGLDGPVIRHAASWSGDGEDAEVRGTVEIEGDCLYVALDEVGERYPIVWPASTSWDPATARVQLPDGGTVGHGDTVYGGGGYHRVADVEAVAGTAAADLAEACVDNQYGEIAIVNNWADGIAAGDRPVDVEEPSTASTDPLGSWLVDELMVDGVRVELDASWPITVAVEGDVITGTAACNQYIGAIDWSSDGGGGRFVVSDLSWTEMACDGPAMELERAFLAALQVVDGYEAADGLYVGAAGAATSFHLTPG